MKRIYAAAMALCLLFCGCTGSDAPPSEPSISSIQPATQPTTVPTEPSSVPTTVPTEPPVVYINPLNGQVLEAPYEKRPVAVMFNNIRQAMPQHGISQADIVYEVLAEGGITRCMGVFSDIAGIGPMGSIRSARRYYVDIARSFGAMYVHAGWSDGVDVDPEIYARDYLEALDWDFLDGVKGKHAWKYFYRDAERLNDGYANEHCLFVDSQGILDYAAEEGFELTREPGQFYGLTFGENPVPQGQSANTVKVYFNMGSLGSWIKHTDFAYQPEDGLYYASQYDKDYIDGNTGAQLMFKNVVVMRAPSKKHTDGVLMVIDLMGSGEGYFACGGQIVPIVWHREEADGPFTYTLTDGTPVTFGVGKTYIAVIPENATVEFD